MNIANKLTMLRILLVPAFVALLLIPAIPHNIAWALLVFFIAAVTDFLDGYIARTRMLVTPLGQFLDPIADKIIVMAALVCFAELRWISSWTVVIILAREFIVSAVRLVAAQSDEKVVIPARNSGKVKTIITMISICTIMFLWMLEGMGIIKYEFEGEIFGELMYRNAPDLLLVPISDVFMYVCAGVTAFSGVQYIYDARAVLSKEFSKKN
jgi:CDP-diacylglycerol--glycerol-3-phosphate 3-phosphatidyltransferase